VQTKLVHAGDAAIEEAARIIKNGGLVAFPTETVYGLGANGLDFKAVEGIFKAKGRPSNNPLIEHISHMDMLQLLTEHVPEEAKVLAEKFWPGPLSIIMPKEKHVPANVTAGLNTVAIRMPDDAVALSLIEKCGVPIAAPSANASGKPSPTDAAAVMQDMSGRIDMILDGVRCSVGVESTVLDLCLETPCILRPGGITAEMLRETLGKVDIHPAALARIDKTQARSPGMLHRHYAPNARMIVLSGEEENVAKEMIRRYDQSINEGLRTRIICTAQCAVRLQGRPACVLGSSERPETMAATLFAELRQADADDIQLILAQAVPVQNIGLAVMNRMLRAAEFNIVEV